MNYQIDHVVFLNDHKYTLRNHMACQKFFFHHTYEEEQGINYVLELINFTNMHDKSKPSQYLTY